MCCSLIWWKSSLLSLLGQVQHGLSGGSLIILPIGNLHWNFHGVQILGSIPISQPAAKPRAESVLVRLGVVSPDSHQHSHCVLNVTLLDEFPQCREHVVFFMTVLGLVSANTASGNHQAVNEMRVPHTENVLQLRFERWHNLLVILLPRCAPSVRRTASNRSVDSDSWGCEQVSNFLRPERVSH